MSDWEKVSLHRLANITMGQSPDSLYYNTVGIGIRFLQGCAEFGDKYPLSVIHCSQPKKIASKNSILFSVRAPVGRINIADTDYCIGRGLAGIFAQNIVPEYLYQYLLWYEKFLQIFSQGSTFSSINSNELYNLEVNKPINKNEQTAIAHILSTVDKAIEHTEKLIAKYKRIKTGLMQDLLTKGIDENGNIRSVKTHQFKDSPLGRIPFEWDIYSLDEASILVTDGSHSSPKPNNSPYIIATVKDMLYDDFNYDQCTQIAESDFNLLSKQNCSPIYGDVLLSKDGTIGNSFVYKTFNKIIVLSSIAIIRLKAKFNPFYLNHILKSFYFDKQLLQIQSGSALKRIVVRDIKKLTFPFPNSIDEQKQIANKIQHIDEFIKIHLNEKNKLFKLKSGLMQDLLTGKVRISEELIAEINKN